MSTEDDSIKKLNVRGDDEEREEEGGVKGSRSKLVRRVKGVVTGVFIVLFVLFVLYSLAAYSIPPTETKIYRSVDYSGGGSLAHYGLFSDESVYKNGTSALYYPGSITSGIKGTYRYQVSRNVSGDYSIELISKYYVQSGKRKVYLKNDTLWETGGVMSDGRFSAPVTIDLEAIESNTSAVRKGLGLPRLSREVYLLVKVTPDGMKEFEHRIYLMKDSSGLLYLKDTSKKYGETSYSRETLTNFIDFLTISVSDATARKLFPVLALLSAIPLLLMYLPRNGRDKERPGNMNELRKYIVEVKGDTFMRVELKGKEDLEKLLDMVDGPILHTVDGDSDVYSLIVGNTIYEYRVPRGSP